MINAKKIHFVKSDEIYPTVYNGFLREKARILELVPSADVEHVGSSAIPGALTIGDLDIQVRVNQEDFKKATKDLKKLYQVNHPELWNEQFALFHWNNHPELPISVVITVAGSIYDEFAKLRDLFKSNPSLLEKYNELKRSFEGKNLEDYKKAKKDFVGPNGNNYLLKKK